MIGFKGVKDLAETLETQLERVQRAIAAIEEGAQEYRIDNRRLKRADLSTLYTRESDLKAAIAAQNGNDVLFAQIGRL